MSSPDLPTVSHFDKDHALATWRDLFIVLWREETTLEAVRRLESEFEGFTRRCGGTAGLFTIVESTAPLPPSDSRDALARFMSSNGERIAVSAVVFEGGGFRGAAVRGVVTGLTMVARQPFPHRVFGSVTDAAAWFVENAPEHWGIAAAQLERAVSHVRREIS